MTTPELDLSKARWFKAAASGGANGGCVEVAHIDGHTAVRDSKDPKGHVLVFTPHEWTCFLDGAVIGEFNRP